MTTPEGKVKAKVNKILSQYDGVYRFMPVPTGYGMTTLDYLLCVHGRFVAIETKTRGKDLTPRQQQTRAAIEAAGGIVLRIDEDNMSELVGVLDQLTGKNNGHYRIAA